MREKNRIRPFIQKVDYEKFINNFTPASEDCGKVLIQKFKEVDPESIIKAWELNPDWRFTQILVNLGFVPNWSGGWYYVEEDEILNKQLNGEKENIS